MTAIFNGSDPKDWTIQQFKGLGEMDAEQLADTTMDPQKRRLKQVTLEEASEDAERMFTTLMGDKVEPRKLFIQDRAHRSQPRSLGMAAEPASRRTFTGGHARA